MIAASEESARWFHSSLTRFGDCNFKVKVYFIEASTYSWRGTSCFPLVLLRLTLNFGLVGIVTFLSCLITTGLYLIIFVRFTVVCLAFAVSVPPKRWGWDAELDLVDETMSTGLVVFGDGLFGKDRLLVVKVELLVGFVSDPLSPMVVLDALFWKLSFLSHGFGLLMGSNPLNFLTLNGDVDCTT